MYEEIRIPRLAATLWRSAPGIAADVGPGDESESDGVPGADPGGESLIVPDGCMDLIVLDAEVVVAGADSTARVVCGARGPAVGLRFDPGVLPQLLATSAVELANTLTPLDAVAAGTPVASRCRVERGFEAGGPAPDPDPGARRLLGIAAALAEATELDPRPMALASTLARGTPIAEAAVQFAYSPRQLRRLAAGWYGYGPKHLAKILRWQAARGLIAGGSTRTAAAAALGYSDAAHLWRDEKALLGR